MNKKYFNELEEEGYKYIQISKDEYPIWDLWDSPELIHVEGLMYKDLLENVIYFFGTRYETSDYDEKTDTVKVERYEDSVLEVDVNDSGDQDDIPNAKKLQDRINNGYTPVVRDILGKFVGAETGYFFANDGELKETFRCEDLVEYLEEKYNL